MKVKDNRPASTPKNSTRNISPTGRTRHGTVQNPREIESTFHKLGLGTYQDRARFLQFSDESSQATSPSYITYISGGSMLAAQAS